MALEFLEDETNEPGNFQPDALHRVASLAKRLRVYDGPLNEPDAEKISFHLLKIIGIVCPDGMCSLKTLGKALERFKKQRNKLSQELIPQLIESQGIDQIGFDGKIIKVENKIKASVSKANFEEVYKDMVKEELEFLEASGAEEVSQSIAEENINNFIKDEIVIDETSNEVKNMLLENDIGYDHKRSIHNQTLEKYCRLQKEQGRRIPQGISTFEYKETKIK
jgi:hypothetical protein